jgi:hypothetical protein
VKSTVNGRVVIEDLPVETLRFDLERTVDDMLTELTPRGPVGANRYDPIKRRREILANAVPLSESVIPHAYAFARDAQRILGTDIPFELYQTAGDTMNACVSRVGANSEVMAIQLVGDLVLRLDETGILEVLGHEVGHAIAHGPSSPLELTQPHLARLLTYGAKGAKTDAVKRLAFCASQARELTADRFGLLACQDLFGFLRSEMAFAMGLPSDALLGDPLAYLEQCRALMESTHADGGFMDESTHPEHSLRSYAAWLFSETDVFRKLTGSGFATRSLRDVDAQLARILNPPSRDDLLEPDLAATSVVRAVPPRTPIPVSYAEEQGPLDRLEAGIRARLPGMADSVRTKVGQTATKVVQGAQSAILKAGLGAIGVLDRREEAAKLPKEDLDELERKFAELERAIEGKEQRRKRRATRAILPPGLG